MQIRIGRDRLFLFGYFIGIILLGSVALRLPQAWAGEGRLSYIDALFTATSAVCVTGLTVVQTAEFTRLGQIIIMCLIQLGGLGLISFATIYVALPRQKISIMSRGIIGDYTLSEVEYRPKSIIRMILGLTFAIEALGSLLLHFSFAQRGYPRFASVFHAVSAFCNAGFSLFPDNLEGYAADPLVNFTIMGLIILGGLGFIVMRDIGKLVARQRTHLSYHSSIVLKTTAALIVAGAAVFLALEYDGAFAGKSFGQKLMAALFASVTPRTAGFDTVAPQNFGTGSTLVTILLMFIGASPASTGGGIKTTTFFILMMTAFRYKDGADSVDYRQRTIRGHTVFKAVGVVVKALVIILLAAVVIAAAEHARGKEPFTIELLYEVISAFGTVGLSLGITPGLGAVSKTALVLTMFIGRIGLFAMALPRGGRKVDGYARLPDAELMIG